MAGLSAAFIGVAGPAATAVAEPQCISAPSPSGAATRILTIGDSLTSAASGDYTWRYFLWKQLVNNGVNADFVGDQHLLVDPVSLVRDSADYRCAFDEDNDAFPGSFLDQYLDATAGGSTVVRDAVANHGSAADALIVFAGGNDLIRNRGLALSPLTPDQLIAKAQQVVAQAQAANPDVKIAMVTAPEFQIAKLSTIQAYNTKLIAQAPGWSTATSTVVVADTARTWTSTYSYDTVHPNPEGEITIASDIADALHALGIGPLATRPLPDLTSLVGPRDPAVLAQPQASGSTVALSWTLPLGSTRTRVEREDVTAGTGWGSLAEVGLPDSRCVTTKPYTCTYSDTSYVPGHVVRYRLVSAKGTTATPGYQYSTSVTSNVVAVPPPGGVAGFAVASTVHGVRLWWSPLDGATGYRFLWFARSKPGTIFTHDAATTSYAISGLAPGVSYGFRVRALDGGTAGPLTDVVYRTPSPYTLARPVVKVAKSGRRFKVTWAAVAHATRDEVQYKAPGRTTWAVVQRSTARSWLGPATRKGKRYQVRVRAYDGLAPGPFSATATYKGP
ncbi:MAG: fibronectin type III domain-containing protein [Marmoricola sp.]